MKFGDMLPFPNKELNPVLRLIGMQESDIMEIREILLTEVKKQNAE